MDRDRLEIIINNILCSVSETSEMDMQEFCLWLETEIGFCTEEIEYFKEKYNCFPNE